MPTPPLPSDPDLDVLKRRARDLQRLVRAGDADARALVEALHPGFARIAADPGLDAFRRADALHVVARWFGFASWPRLREHVALVQELSRTPDGDDPAEEATEDRFVRLACLRYGGDDPGRWEEAERLLAAEPDLPARSLHAAAAAGAIEAVRTHLTADPGAARREGGPHRWSPLLSATYSRLPAAPGRSWVAVVDALLAAGADPDSGYLWHGLPSPFTALTGAFGGGEDGVNQRPHVEGPALARRLLEVGADPNDNQSLYNRMFEPADDHLLLLFEFGLGEGDGGPWRRRLGSAMPSPAQMLEDQLRWAVNDDRPARVRLLLDHGVDPDGLGTDHPTVRGHRPLAWAQRDALDEVAALLRAAGARPVPMDAIDALGAAVLRADRTGVAEASAADPAVVERLRARRPDLVSRAAVRGRLDALRLLADLGFDLSVRQRTTPLHDAVAEGRADVVRLLLDLGADPTVEDEEFHATPLGWAQHLRRPDLAALLPPAAG